MTLTTMLFGKKTQKVSPLTASQVECLLEIAEPADHCGLPYPYLGAGAEAAEYSHFNAHETRDGVWVCCCGHENSLIHFKGAFPFKYFKCGSCGHVLCELCKTTDITTLLQCKEDIQIQHDTELRLFQVCPSCRLSHRAELRAPNHHGKRLYWVRMASHSDTEKCTCGEAANFDWQKYVIGKPYDFRTNPEHATHECQMTFMRRKTAMIASQYPQKRPELAEKRVDSLWERPDHRRLEATTSSETSRNHLRNTLACPPIRQTCCTDSNVRVDSSSLKRSGAQSGRRPSKSPRSATHQGLPVAPRRPVNTRAETWTTADKHSRANEVAEAAILRSAINDLAGVERTPMTADVTTEDEVDWAATYELYQKKLRKKP